MLFQVARSWGICALIGGCVADKKADWNLGLFSGTDIHSFPLEEDSQMGKTEKSLATLIFIQIKWYVMNHQKTFKISGSNTRDDVMIWKYVLEFLTIQFKNFSCVHSIWLKIMICKTAILSDVLYGCETQPPHREWKITLMWISQNEDRRWMNWFTMYYVQWKAWILTVLTPQVLVPELVMMARAYRKNR